VILVVDDDRGILRYMRLTLEAQGYDVMTAGGGLEALRLIQEGAKPDIVLLDVQMPDLDGLHTLEQLRSANPALKVIMVSCLSDASKIVKAMRLGATDYLTKPIDEDELFETLRDCLEKPKATETEDLVELGGDMFFLAASPIMRGIQQQIERIAQVNVPVLLLGESGTGKEVASVLLHQLSDRAQRKFLKVNCAAIPEELLESELFGYEPGAFTGADRSKPGKFEQSDGGTILLDEIGEMPIRLQAKLLQVLQEQKFNRLGSRSTTSVNVRILAATNVNVETAIKQGKLRLDLYYRLNAFTISLPPLRKRREEIPVLFKHYLERLAVAYARAPLTPSPRLVEACEQYSWPGNLRELHNFVKRFLILREEEPMIEELRSHLQVPETPAMPFMAGDTHDLKDVVRNMKHKAEAQIIVRALQQTNWNRRKAAELLNISYKALINKSRQYGILRPRYSATAAPADTTTHPVEGDNGIRTA
jgi:DNA-binding NtrC family response regulator